MFGEIEPCAMLGSALRFRQFLQSYQLLSVALWRRGGDSNSRYGCPYAAFRVRCIQPLCHLSGGRKPLGPLVEAGWISWAWRVDPRREHTGCAEIVPRRIA